MMKRIVAVVAALLLCLSCVACKGHTHTPGDWVTDLEATCVAKGTKHKACTECGETVETGEIPVAQTHMFANGVCSVCGKAEYEKADLATIYKTAAKTAWQVLGAGDPTQEAQPQPTSGAASLLLSPLSFNLPGELPEITGGSTLKSLKADACTMFALVNMIGEYYENDAFIVTTDAVSFTIQSNSLMSQPVTVEITLLPRLDTENGKIYLEMILDMPELSNTAYYHFVLGYDFEGDAGVTSFHLVMIQGGGDKSYSEQKMSADGKFYKRSEFTPEFTSAADALMTAFEAKKAEGQTITGDLAEEFDRYCSIGSRAYMNAMNAQM
ncbi:MAG: hypothetical protein E7585_05520 [Ruminococcaceae bacterium]|nr:hypothetical protein [Oscillospiraceae bacterium]